MTNKEKLEQVNKRLENWKNLGLLEHFDLVLNKLPEAGYLANHRPDDEYLESDLEKGLIDENDYENIPTLQQ